MKWFKHDSDANIDAKLQDVLLEYGAAGYGLYWYCLELIAGRVEADNVSFELEHDARIIARNLGLGVKETEDMMKHMVTLGLFEDNQGVISCLKMARRIDKSMTSNPAMRSIIENLKANKTQLDGYVYLIEKADSDGKVLAYKIGRSKNPTSRVAEISKLDENIGFKLSLLGKVKSDNCVALETELHKKFKSINIYNEWFNPKRELVDYVMTIPDYVMTSSDYDMQDKIRLDKNRIDKIKREGDKEKIPPCLNDLKKYLIEKKGSSDEALINKFFNHYESNGWKVGRNSMKSWKAAMNQWLAREGEHANNRSNENSSGGRQQKLSAVGRVREAAERQLRELDAQEGDDPTVAGTF